MCPHEDLSVEVPTSGLYSHGSWPAVSDSHLKLREGKGELIGRILEYLMQSKEGCVHSQTMEGTDTAGPRGKQGPVSHVMSALPPSGTCYWTNHPN